MGRTTTVQPKREKRRRPPPGHFAEPSVVAEQDAEWTNDDDDNHHHKGGVKPKTSGLTAEERDRVVRILFNKWKSDLFAKNPHLMIIGEARERQERASIILRVSKPGAVRYRKLLK